MEDRIISLFDTLYGRDFRSRAKKLREECLELVEAIDNLSPAPRLAEFDMLIDEMADVEAVMTHVADLLHIDRERLLNMAVDKVEIRLLNPQYK